MGCIDRDRLAALIRRERERYRDLHPGSWSVHERADHLFSRVPMTWMNEWVGRSISRLGARAECRFTRPAPRTGNESAAAAGDELDEYLHLYLANGGVLITPFHNLALMCPATSRDDVDLHTAVFGAAARELVGP